MASPAQREGTRAREHASTPATDIDVRHPAPERRGEKHQPAPPSESQGAAPVAAQIWGSFHAARAFGVASGGGDPARRPIRDEPELRSHCAVFGVRWTCPRARRRGPLRRLEGSLCTVEDVEAVLGATAEESTCESSKQSPRGGQRRMQRGPREAPFEEKVGLQEQLPFRNSIDYKRERERIDQGNRPGEAQQRSSAEEEGIPNTRAMVEAALPRISSLCE